MTNLEKALHWAETLIQQTDEHLPCCNPRLEAELIKQREVAETIVSVLREALDDYKHGDNRRRRFKGDKEKYE